MTQNWDALRQDHGMFDTYPGTVEKGAFVNTTTFGASPKCVLRRMAEANDGLARGMDWRPYEECMETARGSFAELAKVERSRVSLMTSAASSAALVAHGLVAHIGDHRRRKVVVGGSDFASVAMPFQYLCENEERFELDVVPFEVNHSLSLSRLLDAIDESTAVVAVSLVQSASGFVLDVKRLEEHCRNVGVILYVDATQAFLAVPVPALPNSFVACAAYKWLQCPKGVTFMVLPDGWPALGIRPLWPTWVNATDAHKSYYGCNQLAATARRYDMSSSWLLWIAADEALRYLRAIGFEAILERNAYLGARLRRAVKEAGFVALFDGDEQQANCPVVSVLVDNAEAVAAALTERHIVCSVRSVFVRLAVHYYNNEDDIEVTVRALCAARDQ